MPADPPLTICGNGSAWGDNFCQRGQGWAKGIVPYTAVFTYFFSCSRDQPHRAGHQSSICSVTRVTLATTDRPAYPCRTTPDNDIARRGPASTGIFLSGGVLRVVGEWPPPLRRKGFARRAGHPPLVHPPGVLRCLEEPGPRAIGFPGMCPLRVSSAAGDHPENPSPAKVFVRFRPRARAARPHGPSTSPR
jgi:hypothetical protein